MKVERIKEILEHAKILANDLEDAQKFSSYHAYNVEAARRELRALRKQYIFLGNGTAHGFPHEVVVN
jgi:hypothetical protein